MSSQGRASRPNRAEGRSPRQRETFAQAYPHIAKWVRGHGWIKWGDDLFPLERRSCIRALDEGGLIWAGKESYPTPDDALRDLDAALVEAAADQHQPAHQLGPLHRDQQRHDRPVAPAVPGAAHLRGTESASASVHALSSSRPVAGEVSHELSDRLERRQVAPAPAAPTRW
jgi:hypothetical protein